MRSSQGTNSSIKLKKTFKLSPPLWVSVSNRRNVDPSVSSPVIKKVVPFTLTDKSNLENPSKDVLKSLHEDDHKYLGLEDHFKFLLDKFENKNLD